MKSYSSTDVASLDDFALALIGEPFTGKTCLAGELLPPGFHVLCTEFKLAPMRARIGSKPFTYSRPDLKDDGTPQMLSKVFEAAIAHAKAALTDTAVTGLIVDSMTSLGEFLEMHLVEYAGAGKDLIIAGQKAMTMAHWSPYRDLMRKFLIALRTYHKPIVCIFHERVIEDATGNNVLRPMMGGQLKDSVTKLFSDSWRIITKPGGPNGYKRMVRTEPAHNFTQLGHSAPSLPAEFELTADGSHIALLRQHYPLLCPQA